MPADQDQYARTPTGPQLARISNAIVGLLRRHAGKGPTRAKSYLLDDMLIRVLHDVLTPAERTLVEAGQRSKVRDARYELGRALEGEVRAAVEGSLGRPVSDFTSQLLLDEGVAIQVFMLEPGGG